MTFALDDVAVFVEVVESGGFSSAARTLGVPKSSVSRRIARLEERLGVRLLNRTTRAIALTDSGRAYFERVSGALATLREAAGAAEEAREVPKGRVCVSAPPGVGDEALPDVVARFVATYPEVEVQVDIRAETPNLVESGHDLAVVGGRQPDSSLVIRKLRRTDFRLYASPEYLEDAGVPETVKDFAEHAFILFHARSGKCRWTLTGPEGDVDVEVRGRVETNSLAFVRRAAFCGLGIALLPQVPGEMAVKQGLLAPVLAEHFMAGNDLFVIVPSNQHVPPRVRAFCDFLIENFPAVDRLPDGSVAANKMFG